MRVRPIEIAWYFIIGFVVIIGIISYDFIRDFIRYMDLHYGDLIFVRIFPRIFLIVPITAILMLVLIRNTDLKRWILWVICISAILALLLGLFFFELFLFGLFEEARWVIAFEVEFLVMLSLCFLLLRRFFLRKSRETSGKQKVIEESGWKTHNPWIIPIWMLVVSAGIHLVIAAIIGNYLAWIWIIGVGDLVLSFIFESKLQNLFIHVVRRIPVGIKSVYNKTTIWLKNHLSLSQQVSNLDKNKPKIPSAKNYRVNIRITQLPAYADQNQTVSSDPTHPANLNSGIDYNPEIWTVAPRLKTWMRVYQKRWNISGYVMEFICGNGVQLCIGMYTDSEKRGIELGEFVQKNLENTFPSINTSLEVNPVNFHKEILWNLKESPLMHLKLPKAPYAYPIPLIRNITQLCHQGTEFGETRVLIVYQQAVHNDQQGTQGIRRRLHRMTKNGRISAETEKIIGHSWIGSNFDVNVFYQYRNRVYPETNTLNTALVGELLSADIQGLNQKGCKIGKVSKLGLRQVVKGQVRLLNSTLVNPVNVDFHFNHLLPMQRAFEYSPSGFVSQMELESQELIQQNENPDVAADYSPKDLVEIPLPDQSQSKIIDIGEAVTYGSDKKISVSLRIDILRQHVSVFGASRTGKTTLLARLLHKVQKGDPMVTVLLLGLKNSLDVRKFRPTYRTGFCDPNFFAPWGVLPSDPRELEKVREDIGRYLAASMGLLDNVKNYIVNYINELIAENKSIPRSFADFMDGVLNYLKRNPYGESQGDIYRAVHQHAMALRGKKFLEVTQASEKIPDWFKWWLKGTKKNLSIYIDLRDFNESEKRFIIVSILHMVHRFAEPERKAILRRMLVIDEAHIVFKKPNSIDHLSSDTIGQSELEERLERILDEIAETGTGLVFADQNAQKVLKPIVDQVGTHFLFKISRASAREFVETPAQIELLASLHNYYTWVRSGAAMLNVIMKTEDLEKLPDNFSVNNIPMLPEISQKLMKETKLNAKSSDLAENVEEITSSNIFLENKTKREKIELNEIELDRFEKIGKLLNDNRPEDDELFRIWERTGKFRNLYYHRKYEFWTWFKEWYALYSFVDADIEEFTQNIFEFLFRFLLIEEEDSQEGDKDKELFDEICDSLTDLEILDEIISDLEEIERWHYVEALDLILILYNRFYALFYEELRKEFFDRKDLGLFRDANDEEEEEFQELKKKVDSIIQEHSVKRKMEDLK